MEHQRKCDKTYMGKCYTFFLIHPALNLRQLTFSLQKRYEADFLISFFVAVWEFGSLRLAGYSLYRI